MSDERDLLRIFELHEAGRMTRRELFRNLAGVGLSSWAIGQALALSPVAVRQAEAAESQAHVRAWKAATELAKKAKKKKLSILHPTGSVGNMKPYVENWQSIGIELEFIEFPDDAIHTKGMEEAVAKTGRYDVMVVTPMSLPDWAEAGLIYDLTPWVEKYDPELFHPEFGVVYPASHHSQMYKGKIYGLITDGDQWTLLVRSDYLNNPAEKAAFKKKYGHDLRKPPTWTEYDEMTQFFNRPDKKFYGSLEFRSRYYVKWPFMQRFVSKGKLYFDENMKCQFNTPEANQTVKEMKALNPYLHPDAFTFTWSSNYSAYGRGEGFFNFVWPSGYKYSTNPKVSPGSAGKVGVTLVPGTPRKDGSILRASMFPFNWDFTVSRYSQIPELAYLYGQWMNSPVISADAIPHLGGYFDVYRKSHFLNPTPKLLATYSKEFFDMAYPNMVNTIPDFVLRGGFEYQDALDSQLHAALTGTKTVEAAMADTTKAIDRITERIGRAEQIIAWKALAKDLSDPIKKATGVDKWT